MQLLKKILFPTDFGESMEIALESAISIAKKFNSELILLHVLPENSENERLKTLVSEKMDAFIKQIETQQIKCSYELITGNSPDVIIDTAEKKKVNLILLGAGKSRSLDSKLGCNSERIIRKSAMPVWVIEKDKPLLIDTVLCPVDFSEESKIALDSAIHLCKNYKAKLIVLHVVKSYEKEYANLSIDLATDEIGKLEETTASFDEFLKGVNLLGVDIQQELKLGVPADEIINAISSYNVDLLIMGSTGKTGLKRFFVGSVTQRVSQKVPCSFIISKTEKLVHLKLNNSLKDIDSLFQEGVQLLKNGYTKEAIATWEKCTATNELYLKGWAAIISAYDSLGDKENAKKFNDIKNKIQHSIWDQQIEADLRSKHHLFK